MEEDRGRKAQNEDSARTSLQAKGHKGGKFAEKSSGDPNMECYNCHKKGHMAKGGGKEGQGPNEEIDQIRHKKQT